MGRSVLNNCIWSRPGPYGPGCPSQVCTVGNSCSRGDTQSWTKTDQSLDNQTSPVTTYFIFTLRKARSSWKKKNHLPERHSWDSTSSSKSLHQTASCLLALSTSRAANQPQTFTEQLSRQGGIVKRGQTWKRLCGLRWEGEHLGIAGLGWKRGLTTRLSCAVRNPWAWVWHGGRGSGRSFAALEDGKAAPGNWPGWRTVHSQGGAVAEKGASRFDQPVWVLTVRLYWSISLGCLVEVCVFLLEKLGRHERQL